MQIERLGTSAVAPASKTQPDNTASSASAATATGSTPQAQPLSGGNRTVSLGIFDEAATDAQTLPSDFAELVAQKNQELATSLTAALKDAKISTDEPMKLIFDKSSGKITTSGPNKEKIEKFFDERPELAKQFKDVAALNSLLALNTAMRHFNEARRNAKTDQERDQAQSDYTGDTMAIGALGNSMVLSNGVLESPAVVYMAKRIANE